MTKFGDWVQGTGWSVAHLAELVDVSRQSVYTWIDGTSAPGAKALARLEVLSQGKITARTFVGLSPVVVSETTEEGEAGDA